MAVRLKVNYKEGEVSSRFFFLSSGIYIFFTIVFSEVEKLCLT